MEKKDVRVIHTASSVYRLINTTDGLDVAIDGLHIGVISGYNMSEDTSGDYLINLISSKL